MSGPSVSTDDSRQDYSSPDEFMVAVKKKFGPISFDLAAHAGNKQHARYFAPKYFYDVGTAEELKLDLALELPSDVSVKRKSKKGIIYERKTLNADSRRLHPEAYGFDAFTHPWAPLSKKFGDEHPSGSALLYLNCEWANSDQWSRRCEEEMKKGANILLLTHVAISNWFRDNVAGRADVHLLLGRMSFDGKNVYPKDCMVSWYHPRATGEICIWDWRKDLAAPTWKLS